MSRLDTVVTDDGKRICKTHVVTNSTGSPVPPKKFVSTPPGKYNVEIGNYDNLDSPTERFEHINNTKVFFLQLIFTLHRSTKLKCATCDNIVPYLETTYIDDKRICKSCRTPTTPDVVIRPYVPKKLPQCANKCGRKLAPNEKKLNSANERICHLCANPKRVVPVYFDPIYLSDIVAVIVTFGFGILLQSSQDYVNRWSSISFKISFVLCFVLDAMVNADSAIFKNYTAQINEVTSLVKQGVCIIFLKAKISSDSSPIFLLFGFLLGLMVKKSKVKNDDEAVMYLTAGFLAENWWTGDIEIDYLLPLVQPIWDATKNVLVSAGAEYAKILMAIVSAIATLILGTLIGVYEKESLGQFQISNLEDMVVNAFLGMVVIGCMGVALSVADLTENDKIVVDIEAILGLAKPKIGVPMPIRTKEINSDPRECAHTIAGDLMTTKFITKIDAKID